MCVSGAKLCPTLCDPIARSKPGLPVPHHLPEFAQVQVLYISDAIQASYPLTLSSPSTLDLSQHQGLLTLTLTLSWVGMAIPILQMRRLQPR